MTHARLTRPIIVIDMSTCSYREMSRTNKPKVCALGNDVQGTHALYARGDWDCTGSSETPSHSRMSSIGVGAMRNTQRAHARAAAPKSPGECCSRHRSVDIAVGHFIAIVQRLHTLLHFEILCVGLLGHVERRETRSLEAGEDGFVLLPHVVVREVYVQ